mmetsp:Transcript_32626/g.79380  ORF Transcript_32626/g.79380 Transcript_32626/m.79380 type:complete len:429 (+) Transcript_32626:1214-2500(+)
MRGEPKATWKRLEMRRDDGVDDRGTSLERFRMVSCNVCASLSFSLPLPLHLSPLSPHPDTHTLSLALSRSAGVPRLGGGPVRRAGRASSRAACVACACACACAPAIRKVAACGVNNTDLWTREGAYSAGDDDESGWTPLSFPRIQGADVVGTVLALGGGVKSPLKGNRVLVNPTIHGDDGECDCKFVGSEVDGGFASHCVVPAANAIPIPAECKLKMVELASFATAYQTAWHMIKRARVQKGERVIISGASGGVGTALVQMCAHLGAHVLGITSTAKAKAVRDLGAQAVVTREQASTTKGLTTALTTLPAESKVSKAGGYADVVLDVVAGDQLMPMLDALRPRGRYACAGAIAGKFPKVHWPTFYLKQLDLLGCMLATKEEFKELAQLIFDGKLRPLVAAVFPLKNLREAQTFFQKKTFVGKLVIDCA